MTRSFCDVQATEDPCSFRIVANDDVCVGPPGNVFLFGGVGMAAAIVAMQRVTGRTPIYAAAQFLSYARRDTVLDIAVALPVAGRNISQATAVARIGGDVIFSVLGAFGDRDGQPDHQWIVMPTMPTPDACVTWPIWPKQGAGLNARLELRLEVGGGGTHPRDGRVDPDGRLRLWIRTVDDLPVDAAMLAVFADFIPAAAAAALGTVGGGNSLDNSLRLRAIVPTRWVLCDMKMTAVSRGFGHGEVRLFAEDGTLMATAGQSLILRGFVPDPSQATGG